MRWEPIGPSSPLLWGSPSHAGAEGRGTGNTTQPPGILLHRTQSLAGQPVMAKPWQKGQITLNTQVLWPPRPQPLEAEPRPEISIPQSPLGGKIHSCLALMRK